MTPGLNNVRVATLLDAGSRSEPMPIPVLFAAAAFLIIASMAWFSKSVDSYAVHRWSSVRDTSLRSSAPA
jgi:hypothetical protein